jgi:uncharacterized protein (TIGR00730 family)
MEKKVAVFGSARVSPGTDLYKASEKLGRKIAECGWVVVTGGGPGIMESVNKGATSVCGTDGRLCSIAQAIYLPFEESINPYVQEYEKHETFYSRLKTFAECDAFVVAPGGIGTLLEMAMIYQLVQVNHIEKKPIICVGRMWRTLKSWIEDEMLDNGFLSNDEMKLIHYVDRFSESIHLLKGLLGE